MEERSADSPTPVTTLLLLSSFGGRDATRMLDAPAGPS